MAVLILENINLVDGREISNFALIAIRKEILKCIVAHVSNFGNKLIKCYGVEVAKCGSTQTVTECFNKIYQNLNRQMAI